ncbi:MAG: YigZ family protein [Bacteroidota bacterium]|nr:YigZ family protein [Bacteroidota bacterium]MDP4233957.1 YigZ family protein [Bacteroidota bacterium]MDP4242792.1 YigZ family protein [Bacteroidota bacterium]MDP4288506.1 YigZ family protein [Bacteroidota bacterium]
MTNEEDFYYTIAAPLRAPELKVRGSRFIADLLPMGSKEEIDAALASIRKEFHDATHHCFAYRLGADAKLVRAADDGEPNGTAGKPILLVLTSQKLTNVLLVVTRYFGGTKLGTGGLARAYAESAQQAVSMAHIIRVYLTSNVALQVLYEDLPAMERLIKAFEGVIQESTYLESVSLIVAIRRSKITEFRHAVKDTFHGRVAAEFHT